MIFDLFDNKKVKFISFHKVNFWAACSQFLLNATVNEHVERYCIIEADFVKRIRDKFYVEDLTNGIIRN